MFHVHIKCHCYDADQVCAHSACTHVQYHHETAIDTMLSGPLIKHNMQICSCDEQNSPLELGQSDQPHHALAANLPVWLKASSSSTHPSSESADHVDLCDVDLLLQAARPKQAKQIAQHY